MTAAEPEFLQADYWGAVSQLVPVVGLALVLEVRRSVSRWTIEGPIFRALYILSFIALAYLLVQIETWSLTALQFRQDDEVRASIANLTVGGTLSFLALNTLIVVGTNVTQDTFRLLSQVLPGRPIWKLKQEVKQTSRLYAEKIAPVLAAYDQSAKDIKLAKKNLKVAKAVPSAETRFGPITAFPPEATWHLKEYDRLRVERVKDNRAIIRISKDIWKNRSEALHLYDTAVQDLEALKELLADGSIQREVLASSSARVKEYIDGLKQP